MLRKRCHSSKNAMRKTSAHPVSPRNLNLAGIRLFVSLLLAALPFPLFAASRLRRAGDLYTGLATSLHSSHALTGSSNSTRVCHVSYGEMTMVLAVSGLVLSKRCRRWLGKFGPSGPSADYLLSSHQHRSGAMSLLASLLLFLLCPRTVRSLAVGHLCITSSIHCSVTEPPGHVMNVGL